MVDAEGNQLAELHGEQDRDPVALEQIPQVVRDAVIAVEDARFYEHVGVDARAIARALVVNTIEREILQGGSTITQQLVKNAITGDDQTVDRKLAEASLAIQLEADLTKDEILEAYLNTVYFGNGSYGIGAAARRYFGIDVSQLDLHQAALLAGMLRAPANFDPYDRPAQARGRRDLVLDLMSEQSLITEAEQEAAISQGLGVQPLPPDIDWVHPYAVDHALEELQRNPVFHVLGATASERAERLFGGGLRIQTTIQPQAQLAAQQAIDAILIAPASDPRAALVAVEPATGAITALVGGEDYTDPLDPVARFNLATDGRRQPGSSFKPVVLAAALEAGWSLDDVIPSPAQVSVPLAPGLPDWNVGNAGGQGYGELTLRTATALSVNTAFANLINDVGAEAVVDMAGRLGITSDLRPLQSIALGAQEVSPLEMATVTATIAAGGVRRDPGIIQSITDRDGVVIWERPVDDGEQVIDPEIAQAITLAMVEVVRSGTGVGADLGRPTAGKTGTSQDNADAWFTGFTPDLATAVWIGYPEGRVAMVPPRTRVIVQGGGWPAEVFARFGVQALADQVATPFANVDGELITVTVDLTRDCLPNPFTPRSVIGERGYVVGSEPTEVCAEPSGPPTVDVPVVEGLSADQARQALNEAGFTVFEKPQFDTSRPPGVVIAQSPSPGADQVLAETGFNATITISSADRTGTIVPDLLGRSIAVARETLEEQGFNVSVRLECPDGSIDCVGAAQSPGVVWQQSPEATQRVPVFSEVTLFAYPG